MRGAISKFFPVANHEMTKAAVCMFTTTQDSHFIVDLHPKQTQLQVLPAAVSLWTLSTVTRMKTQPTPTRLLLHQVCIDFLHPFTCHSHKCSTRHSAVVHAWLTLGLSLLLYKATCSFLPCDSYLWPACRHLLFYSSSCASFAIMPSFAVQHAA